MNIEDYTKAKIEEEGTFRVFPLSWTLEPSEKTGSVALAIRLGISRKWHGKEAGWSNEYDPGWYVEHRAWILVRPKDENGKPIDGVEPVLAKKAFERLKAAGLWDGDWDKIDGKPPSIFVLADVKGESYEGNVRYRADWLNLNAEEPAARGSFPAVDRKLLDSLKAKHGAKTAALGAGAPGTLAAAPAPPGLGAPATNAPEPEATLGSPVPAPAPNAAPDTVAWAPPAPEAAPAVSVPPAAGGSGQPPAWGADTVPGAPATADAAPPAADGLPPVDPDKPPF